MPVVRNDVEAYHEDRLVVEQRHAGLVQEALRRRGIASNEADSSVALGLTLLQLPEVESAVAVLRQDSALVEAATRAQQALGHPAGQIGDLDLVLFMLRQSTREAYDGWVPAVDKDQVLDRVQGSPYIKGGVGIPQPIAPLSIPPVTRQGGPRVAILDTKLLAHPDLIGRFLGDSAADLGDKPLDTQGHSTFIAGLIVQRAPTAELVVRTALNEKGENASSWDVATRMISFLDAEVAVLNVSLGCATIGRVPPLSLRRAVDRLTPTVVVVAAAGNNGLPDALAASEGLTPVTPIFPAAIDGVVAVGAYDSRSGSTQPAPFSPPGVPWVGLLAPGVGVQSTFLPGVVRLLKRDGAGQLVDDGTADFGQPGYASWDGTSFAAANVTGAIAALMAAGQVSAYEALDQLRNPAAPGGDILPFDPA
jgi:subtilisin family serine protease